MYKEKAVCCLKPGDSILTDMFGFTKVTKIEHDYNQYYMIVEFYGISGKFKLPSNREYLCKEDLR